VEAGGLSCGGGVTRQPTTRAAAARGIEARVLAPRHRLPSAVPGIPGGWPANEGPAFYDDAAGLRASRGALAAAARGGC